MLDTKKLFIKFTFLLYIIAVLHLLALYFFWYWSYWWTDIPMHFLGGVWVGGMGVLLYAQYKKKTIDCMKIATVYSVSIISILIIGLFWELFEFSLDTFIIFQPNDIVDTSSDLAMDIAGALYASIYIIRKRI